MNAEGSHRERFTVVIAGGGVAALEAALALRALAGERVEMIVVAPNDEFVYRPMTVREPFAYGAARRYAIAPLVGAAGAKLLAGSLARVDTEARTVHMHDGRELHYDALLLALGAKLVARYAHALTVDDRRLQEAFEGLVQDVEGGYARRLAFVSPGRMAWPLPLYELALMTAGRAYDMGVEITASIVTPESAPLAVFGEAASAAVSRTLERAGVEVITSAHAEVPVQGEVLIKPEDRRLEVDRVVALPELYGPSLRGVPLGENGFIHVDGHGHVSGAGPVFAAGDATEFPIKHGGLAAQAADTAAEAIAALAGAPVEPAPFRPVLQAILLTDEDPLYLEARIANGLVVDSQVLPTPSWSPAGKIAAKHLAPLLDEQSERAAAGPPQQASRSD